MKALAFFTVLAVAFVATAGTLVPADCKNCPETSQQPCMDCPPVTVVPACIFCPRQNQQQAN